MLSFLVNIVSGMLCEVLFFTMFLIYAKNIKEKKLTLGILIGIAYILCIMISRFKLLYYVGFIAIVYIILKILYRNKTQIIDIFVFSLSTLYLTLSSYLLHFLICEDNSNYYYIYVLSRISLLIPFIFKNKFNYLYKKYASMWNRNDNIKKPIKSITLRNISLILTNLFIFLLNFAILVKVGFI